RVVFEIVVERRGNVVDLNFGVLGIEADLAGRERRDHVAKDRNVDAVEIHADLVALLLDLEIVPSTDLEERGARLQEFLLAAEKLVEFPDFPSIGLARDVVKPVRLVVPHNPCAFPRIGRRARAQLASGLMRPRNLISPEKLVLLSASAAWVSFGRVAAL